MALLQLIRISKFLELMLLFLNQLLLAMVDSSLMRKVSLFMLTVMA